MQVRLQVRLAQPFARPVGQGGHSIRREADERRDLGRRSPLDLGVPEHELPALGQRGERTGDERSIVPARRPRLERGVDDVGHLAERIEVGVGAGAVVKHVADAGEEIRPERQLGPPAATDGVEHAGEALGHEVVEVGATTDERACRRSGGVAVASEQFAVGAVVVQARRGDELCVAATIYLDGYR